jgi:hypothetical protein
MSISSSVVPTSDIHRLAISLTFSGFAIPQD